jgi:LacI family transcriptional regulator
MNLTSREIARLVGVSVSTVSLVLNGKPGVSDETRRLILDILEANGMSLPKRKPSNDGGVLRFYQIAKHGFIINDRHSRFISDYTDGIIEEAKTNNYTVEVSTFQGTDIQSLCNMLRSSNGISGCIILATELSQTDVEVFFGLNMPVVFLDAYYEFISGDFVTMDNQNMTCQAVKHLYESGHTKIGMLYSEGGSNFDLRHISFRRVLSAFNLPVNDEWIIKIGSTLESSYADMVNILKEKKQNFPTAFFTCNDILAIGAIRAFQEFDFKIPDDISFVGFDDLPVSSFIIPPLSTLSVPKHEIGQQSVKMLLRQIPNKYTDQKCLLGGELIKRDSVLQKSNDD